MSLSDIKTRIADAEVKYSRPQATTSLIAVSKLQPNERVLKVLDAGHLEFGENYVQEAASKWPTWRENYSKLKLHMLAHYKQIKQGRLWNYSTIFTLSIVQSSQKQ